MSNRYGLLCMTIFAALVLAPQRSSAQGANDCTERAMRTVIDHADYSAFIRAEMAPDLQNRPWTFSPIVYGLVFPNACYMAAVSYWTIRSERLDDGAMIHWEVRGRAVLGFSQGVFRVVAHMEERERPSAGPVDTVIPLLRDTTSDGLDELLEYEPAMYGMTSQLTTYSFTSGSLFTVLSEVGDVPQPTAPPAAPPLPPQTGDCDPVAIASAMDAPTTGAASLIRQLLPAQERARWVFQRPVTGSFVNAQCTSGALIHMITREVVVPTAQRTLNGVVETRVRVPSTRVAIAVFVLDHGQLRLVARGDASTFGTPARTHVGLLARDVDRDGIQELVEAIMMEEAMGSSNRETIYRLQGSAIVRASEQPRVHASNP